MNVVLFLYFYKWNLNAIPLDCIYEKRNATWLFRSQIQTNLYF